MHLEPSKSCFFSLNRLNFLTYLVNVGNAVVAFAIVLVWCVTKSGEKAAWMKVTDLTELEVTALYKQTYFITI